MSKKRRSQPDDPDINEEIDRILGKEKKVKCTFRDEDKICSITGEFCERVSRDCPNFEEDVSDTSLDSEIDINDMQPD